jgi:hypothetical protein
VRVIIALNQRFAEDATTLDDSGLMAGSLPGPCIEAQSQTKQTTTKMTATSTAALGNERH